MRELTYFIASSLDGYVADPSGGDPTDLSPGGFFLAQGDHSVPLLTAYPETVPGAVREALGIDAENRVFDTVLMGRKSWELGLEHGHTNAYPRLRNLVFTRTLAESPDPTVEFVSTDPVERVRELKREEGLGIWLCGGGSLAESLWPEIDRLVVKVNPVVIGAGVKLFATDNFAVRRLKLTDHQVYESGVAVLTYRKA
ncbi:dihydrofolate reductase [Kribbella antibiotica]|uniref:Dihydrofolate reductase n=1 Tax=Kribbella antibiotica TaxID=190195 RepID=A0A4R4YJS9_9ACTN|nr:dihydrofolate reductase family protein [Kribbella antibiotica]TDD45153.1 dihydrofolate reductase [Kribbella antibiotica]